MNLSKNAGRTALLLLTANSIFHMLMLVGLLPQDIVWGSRISSQSEFIRLESLALAASLLFLTILMLKTGLLKSRLSPKAINTFIWIMAIFFLLNTAGNLASGNQFEKWVFSPLTLVLSICLFILVWPVKRSKLQDYSSQ